MEQISITDIIAIVGVIVMLWRTFFSKEDKRKLAGENEKLAAETNRTEAETIDRYEDSIKKLLDRIDALEKKQDEDDKRTAGYDKKIKEYDKRIRILEKEIARKDLIIDCLDVTYRELARRAIKEGIENVSMETPCYHLDNDEEEEEDF